MTNQPIEYLIKKHNCLVVDTCCLLCLHVSGYLREVFAVTAPRIAVPEYIQSTEILDFDLGPYREDHTLTVVVPDDLIYASVTEDFASQNLDNGEAFVGAFAKRNGWALATDDRSATRVFARDLPQLQLVDTPAMLKHWAEQRHPPDPLVRQALLAVQDRGRFKPKREHVLHGWWEGKVIIKESST